MKTYLCVILLFSQVVWSQQMENPEPAILGLSEFTNVRDFTITSSGDEAYFSLQSPLGEVSAIMCLKKTNSAWSEPFISPFSGKYNDTEPFLSPDNLRLYFASNRPLQKADDITKDFDIWYVSRETLSSSWGDPVNLGSPVNSEKNEFYPSLARNKNLYFTSDLSSSKGKDDIFFSKWEGNAYQEPISLSNSINSEGYEFNAFVSPDESFLIFSGYNRADGLGSADLYISLKKGNVWQMATNMGSEVNSDKMDYCPFVDINSMTLYFTSKRSRIEAESSFKSLDELLKEIERYENGQSRLYKLKAHKLLRTNKN